jgi:hypothetical protein
MKTKFYPFLSTKDEEKYELKERKIEKEETENKQEKEKIKTLNRIPIELNKKGAIGDLTSILNNPEIIDKKILKQEIEIELLQNKEYFQDLLKNFESQNTFSEMDEFLENEIDKLIKRGKQITINFIKRKK